MKVADEAFYVFLCEKAECFGLDLDKAADTYRGHWRDREAFASAILANIDIPDTVRPYVDVRRYTDAIFDGNTAFYSLEVADGVAVFEQLRPCGDVRSSGTPAPHPKRGAGSRTRPPRSGCAHSPVRVRAGWAASPASLLPAGRLAEQRK